MNEEQKNTENPKDDDMNILPEDPTLRGKLEKIATFERDHGLVGVSAQRKEGQSVTASESVDHVIDDIENGTKLMERLNEIPIAPSRPNPLFTRRG